MPGFRPRPCRPSPAILGEQVTMDRYGHPFRSESHDRAMDASADTIDASVRAEPVPNANRKWADFTP